MRRSNLICLVFSPNVLYTSLLDHDQFPEGLTIDMENQTWIFQGRSKRIGEDDISTIDGGVPVGVFDRTVFAHLKTMERIARRVQEAHSSCSRDD